MPQGSTLGPLKVFFLIFLALSYDHRPLRWFESPFRENTATSPASLVSSRLTRGRHEPRVVGLVVTFYQRKKKNKTWESRKSFRVSRPFFWSTTSSDKFHRCVALVLAALPGPADGVRHLRQLDDVTFKRAVLHKSGM